MTQDLQPPVENRIPAGSKDYVVATLTSRPIGDDPAVDLDMTVDVAIDAATALVGLDETVTWLGADWVGAQWQETIDNVTVNKRKVRTDAPVDTALLDDEGESGTRYGVWVRITDTPTIPIVFAGYLVLT